MGYSKACANFLSWCEATIVNIGGTNMEMSDSWNTIFDYLHQVDKNWQNRDSEAVLQLLEDLKRRALQADDQTEAKRIWRHEQIVHIQDHYIAAFREMKEKKYCEFVARNRLYWLQH